ncbi:type II secretion system protein GspL [Scleromatobacter humisilvae]|uniref:Type II secretion system protein GspL n=1 Tax=Scleromatobacter humisilvae TaxID=2897159 RepID=A0A9X2C1W9_9BURK|nr:type II secretion system protein GspL [Scleromatobacter humisilvae]MCK9685445.1 type II secretion system protein GspL [Scleromatobacter humisilvae]
MSTLIILLAAQPRLAAPTTAGHVAPAEFDYVLSADGTRVTDHGRATPAALPRASLVVAVLRPGDVAFQRVAIPKAPAARMRAALTGVMEEGLLEDEDEIHLALAPDAKPGGEHWVAVVNKPWLRAQLAALEAGNVALDRAVPSWWPDQGVAGHTFREGGPDEPAQLAWRDDAGVLCVPLASPVARALLTALPEDTVVRWTATPETALDASEFVGMPVASVTDEEQGLRAARAGWTLLQFELAPQRRGVKLVRDLAARFAFDPAWRVTRMGLIALVAVTLLGLNIRAFQENHRIAQKKAALATAVAEAFPNLKTIYDPAAQAQRELDTLRAAAGRPGDGDIETLMQAAESAWPQSHSPISNLKFEPGRLTLPADGWTPQEIERFTTQLRAANVDVQSGTGKLVLSHRQPSVRSKK